MSEQNWKPEFINHTTTYIICPDPTCQGFVEDRLRCTVSPKSYMGNKPEDVCPHYDKGKKVLFCYKGHPTEMELDYNPWTRVDCSVCHSSNFNLMSGLYRKIPLENYDEFLKIPFEKK